jgi:hypothetical protein
MALTDAEQVQVVSYLSAAPADDVASTVAGNATADADAASNEASAVAPDVNAVASSTADEKEKPTTWQRLAKVWPFVPDAE